MVAIFLLVVGSICLIGAFNLMRKTLAARGWPVVSGRIIERDVGPATTTGGSRPGRYFEPLVKYSYTVEGKSYTGQRITLTKNAYNADTARSMVDKLPDDVEVHYNPEAPGEAYLQPSAVALGVFMMSISALGVLIGAGLLLSMLFARNG
jgi:hypothetical protein